MSGALSKDELISRLVKAGELEVEGAPPEEIASYFDIARFRFHGPDGFETDYEGLRAYFASIRAAFEDRSIRRGIILVDGNLVACQTWIEGRFAGNSRCCRQDRCLRTLRGSPGTLSAFSASTTKGGSSRNWFARTIGVSHVNSAHKADKSGDILAASPT